MDFSNAMQYVLLHSKKLGKEFKSIDDIQKKMQTDAGFYKKMQQEIGDVIKQGINELNEKTLKQLDEANATQEHRQEALEKIEETELAINKDITENLELTKRQLEANKKVELVLDNIKDVVDKVGNQIRHPSQAANNILTKMGKWAPALMKANQEGKSFGTILKDMGSFLAESGKSALKLFGPTGLLIVGVATATAALTVLFKLFSNYYDFLDKKIMPANAEFNKQLGAGADGAEHLKHTMNSVGVEFEQLGYSFEDGAKLVRDFASGLRDTTFDKDKKMLKAAKEMIGVLQLSGEEAGNLAFRFKASGQSVDDLNSMFKAGYKEAKAYSIPPNDVLRDLAKFPDVMARFGASNRTQFATATAKARSYGKTIGEINAAFGEQLDTFSSTSEVAAKLNSVFGTQINSYKLMLEKDPTKRMEMLRGELGKHHKAWKDLSVAEQNVLASTLHLSKADAELYFADEKTRKNLEKNAAKKKADAALNEKMGKTIDDWNKGLGSIQKTLIAWQPLIDQLMRAISDFLAKLFGFKSAQAGITDFTTTAGNAIRDVTKAINNAAGHIEHYKDVWDDWTMSGRMVDVESAKDAVTLINKQNRSLEEQGKLRELLENKDVKNITARKLRLEGRAGEEAAKLLDQAEKEATITTEGLKDLQDVSSAQLFYQKEAKETIKKVDDLVTAIKEDKYKEISFPEDDFSAVEAKPQVQTNEPKVRAPVEAKVPPQAEVKEPQREKQKREPRERKEKNNNNVPQMPDRFILETDLGDMVLRKADKMKSKMVRGTRGSR